jgi:hypothetical protein
MLTPRNQDGTAPFSTLEDIDIGFNTIRHGSSAVTVLGTDDNATSRRASRIAIHDNTFDDIDPVAWGGSDKLFLILGGPVDLSIDRNVLTGQHIGSQVYFDGAPPCVRLLIRDNRWPVSLYGVFGSNVSVGGTPNNAFTAFAPDGTLSGNVETP